jgi:hypothetical protein
MTGVDSSFPLVPRSSTPIHDAHTVEVSEQQILYKECNIVGLFCGKAWPWCRVEFLCIGKLWGDSIKFERLLLPRQLRWEKLRSTDADRQAHFCQDTEVGEYRHKHAVGCQFSL